VPLLSVVHVSVLNFHPEEFARQVTLIEQKYFRKILPKELLGIYRPHWSIFSTHFSNNPL